MVKQKRINLPSVVNVFSILTFVRDNTCRGICPRKWERRKADVGSTGRNGACF